MTYPSIRLYYPGGKAGSFGALAQGYLQAFRDLGITHAAFDYRVPPDEDGFGAGGATYDIGIYLGEPSHLHLMQMHARHKERFLVLAPNGYGVPSVILKACEKYGVKILAPSKWASDVIRDSGSECEVARHGVHLVLPKEGTRRKYGSEELAALAEHWTSVQNGDRGEKIELVHFTSTATDRKGTLSILNAMEDLMMSEMCSLEIKCDPHVGPVLEAIVSKMKYRARREISINTENIPNDGKLAWYIDGFDAVLQPSRAEGFGLVPLEAASIGVPSILTSTTGHGEFCFDLGGSFVVHQNLSGEDDYEFTEGEEFSVAPLDSKYIFSAVGQMKDQLWHKNHQAIANSWAIRQKWSWTAVVKHWLENRT